MRSEAQTVEAYIEEQDPSRQAALKQLRSVILKHLPAGFKEEMSYGMVGYVVPFSAYPAGYHCDPTKPLPFLNFASQKNSIALYHMGLYVDAELMKWFSEKAFALGLKKGDFGKSCIRFKKPDAIPFALIGELCSRMTLDTWVQLYESKVKR